MEVADFWSSIHSEESVERAIVYNQDGSVLFPERMGTLNEVEFTHEELSQMRGKTLVHTHVDTGDLTDRMLSPEDLYTASFYGMGEIQAATSSSISAFSPGTVLFGNTSMRNQFIDGYNDIIESGRMNIETLADDVKITEGVLEIAKAMSDYLKSNKRKFGYSYEERGVFD